MSDPQSDSPPAGQKPPPVITPPAVITPPGPLPPMPKEIGGAAGPEPTRYGDWEHKGRCTDF